MNANTSTGRITILAAALVLVLLAIVFALGLRSTHTPPARVLLNLAEEPPPPVHPIFGTVQKTFAVDSSAALSEAAPPGLKMWLEKFGRGEPYGPPPANQRNLSLGQTELQWSSGGYLYFCAPNSGQPLWEFASCSKATLSEVAPQDLTARFVSFKDKANGQAVFGTNWLRSGQGIRVNQGLVILARVAGDPTQVYALEIAKQNLTNAIVFFIKLPYESN